MAEDAFAGFLNEQVEDLIDLWRANRTPGTQGIHSSGLAGSVSFFNITGHDLWKVWGVESGHRGRPAAVWPTLGLLLQSPLVPHPTGTGTGPWQRLSCGN